MTDEGMRLLIEGCLFFVGIVVMIVLHSLWRDLTEEW